MEKTLKLKIRFDLGSKEKIERLFREAKVNHHSSYNNWLTALKKYGATFSYRDEGFRDFTGLEVKDNLDIAVLKGCESDKYLRDDYFATLSYTGELGGKNSLFYAIDCQKNVAINIRSNIRNAEELAIVVLGEIECLQILSKINTKVDVLSNFEELRRIFYVGKEKAFV